MIAVRPGPVSVARDEPRARPLADRVLERIWSERRISRAGIAEQLGLSRSTASEIVSGLLQTGLVAEVGDGPSRGGRRPIMLEFQDDAHVILGVEMGAAHIGAVLTDLRGRVLQSESRPHAVRDDPDGARRLIVRLCDTCLGESEASLLGIGVGVPAPVDPERPGHLPERVLPAWEGQTGFEAIQSRYGVPLLVDNDANLGALAEAWWGAGLGKADLTYIKVSTGVGSGHLVRGEIYRGATGVAGEIGHVTIDPRGNPCVCGNRGCLSTFVGSRELVARARSLLAEYPDSVLAEIELSVYAIEDAADEGDALALRIVDEAAQHLGTAIAGVLNLMNPSAVVLGGSLARLGERLLVPLREVVFAKTLVSSVAAAEIRTSELGPQAIAIGASTSVLDAALKQPVLFFGVER